MMWMRKSWTKTTGKGTSGENLMDKNPLSDAELDNHLDSSKDKLYQVGIESVELQKEFHDLKQHNLSNSCADPDSWALLIYDQKSVQFEVLALARLIAGQFHQLFILGI